MTGNNAIKGLGEVALRVNDLETMANFYEQVIGLEPWRSIENAVFFRIGDGYAGHTRVFVLFDRSAVDPVPPRADASTLDHLAFEISLSDFDAEHARLQSLGLSVRTREFPDFGWRGLFIEDPEGNTVEFVCYDDGL